MSLGAPTVRSRSQPDQVADPNPLPAPTTGRRGLGPGLRARLFLVLWPVL